MRVVKKVPFEWELGETLVSLQVDSYYYSNSLAIQMIDYEEEEVGLFADMTINIPGVSLAPNESVISGDISRDLVKFIKVQKLGKVLPYHIKSGMGKYAVVAFDLEKLREFDPEGVDRFKRLRGISGEQEKEVR